MVETFGLPAPDQLMEREQVQAIMDANQDKILPVLRSMATATNTQLEGNQQRINAIYKRMKNSTNGHIRRNQSILQTVGNAMVAPVKDALAWNDSVIGAALHNPGIAETIRNLPLPPTYILPTPISSIPPHNPPPTDGVGIHTINAGAVLSPPPAPASNHPPLPPRTQATMTYSILVDPTGQHAMAIPGTPQQWQSHGFTVPHGWSIRSVWHGTESGVTAFLNAM